jgi:hypothetical protein
MISLIRSHTTKSLLRCGVIVTSLALATNAFAANVSIPHPAAAAHVTHRVVTRNQRPAFVQPAGIGQLVGAMLGMVPPQYAGIVQSAMRQAASHQSSGTYDDSSGTYDPTFDSPSPSTPIDNSASDAAAASAAAASEQNLNDDTAMTASMAAAEQQNDAANAAALQTEINAGM